MKPDVAVNYSTLECHPNLSAHLCPESAAPREGSRVAAGTEENDESMDETEKNKIRTMRKTVTRTLTKRARERAREGTAKACMTASTRTGRDDEGRQQTTREPDMST